MWLSVVLESGDTIIKYLQSVTESTKNIHTPFTFSMHNYIEYRSIGSMP